MAKPKPVAFRVLDRELSLILVLEDIKTKLWMGTALTKRIEGVIARLQVPAPAMDRCDLIEVRDALEVGFDNCGHDPKSVWAGPLAKVKAALGEVHTP